METAEERFDSIEEIMKELSLAQLNTERELTRLSESLKESHKRSDKIDKNIEVIYQRIEKSHQRTQMDFKLMNKKWGELANRMGTVVEDIVAPNIIAIAQKHFSCEIEHLMIRTVKKLKDNNKLREFDVIAVCKDSVILNSTKTTPSIDYINEFSELIKSGEFYDFFPELKSKTLIPIFSSLSMREDLIDYLSKLNIYAMVLKGDTMELVNFDKIRL